MKETKPIFESKIFVSSVVGIIASVAMYFMREAGISYAIDAQVQAHVTTVILAAVAFWRTRPTKKLVIGRTNKDIELYGAKYEETESGILKRTGNE